MCLAYMYIYMYLCIRVSVYIHMYIHVHVSKTWKGPSLARPLGCLVRYWKAHTKEVEIRESQRPRRFLYVQYVHT